jgi:hypothetical protein
MPSDDELKARLLASMGLPGAKADSQLEAMKAIMAAKTKEDGSVWEPITEPEPEPGAAAPESESEPEPSEWAALSEREAVAWETARLKQMHKDLVADVHTIKHGTRRFRLGPPGAITRPSRSP